MVAGDTAYIRAGVYRETVKPVNSGTQAAPITFMPYNGEAVTVSGADVIPANSWTPYRGNIYQAPMAWSLVTGPDQYPIGNQIFLDSQMMIEARWPNTTLDVSHPTLAFAAGGSYVDGGSGLSTGTITDPNLPSRPAGYWNGATIHASLGAGWLWQTGAVVNSAANQLSFAFTPGFSSLTPGPGNPYYLSGLLSELDSPGEWFLDTVSFKLYLWTPGGDSPMQHQVEAKRRKFTFDLSGLSFVTILGLNFVAAGVNSDSQTQYLVLDGLNAKYISHYSAISGQPWFVGFQTGIYLNGNYNVIRNSTIAFSAGTGVGLNGSGHRAFNNVIHDTDYNGTYASPIMAGPIASNGLVISYNTIYNSGRFGIYHPNFSSGRILHNEIYNIGLQTSDLGATYAGNSDGQGSEIGYTLIHDNFGLPTCYYSPNCTEKNLYLDDGVYLDNGSSNYIIHHNVVWNTPISIGLNSPSTNNKVYNNTFVGSNTGLAAPYSVSGPVTMPGTVIENNIFTNPLPATPEAVVQNNLLSGTDPDFIDPAHHDYQLIPTSPAIGVGLALPPWTNGYSGSGPDIGAYDHTKPPWKAGVQNAATVSAPSYAPTLTPGTIAVVTGSVAFDSGVSVLLTDGAGVDSYAPLLYVLASPPQLAFRVPSATAPGVAMITITNGDGAISLSSAPLFAGAPPITIAASQGSGQSAPINTPFSTGLQATVSDARGNLMPGAAVVFAVPATGAGGTFAASATVTTNSAGVAVAPPFKANAVAGTYSVTASAAGVGALAVFSLTNRAGAPSTVTATQGSGQAAAINTAFATALKAAVEDAGGNGVPGITVTFAAPGTGASGNFAGPLAVQTDAAGLATAPPLTANGTTGSYSMTAGAAGVSAPAIFTLTNKGAAGIITPGGIAGVGGSVPPVQAFSQNALISIYGRGFLPAGVAGRRVLPSEYVNGGLPTVLLGVCVDVGGQRAAMLDVYPNQINAQFPAVTGASASARVLTNCGTPIETASTPQTVAVRAASPEFLYFQLNSDGNNPVVLVNAVTGALVGPSSILSGVLTPARVGDVLTAYGTGFGPLTPAVATGQIPAGTASAMGPVSVSIGGVALAATDILYAGAAPGQIIDQLNFRVPAGVVVGNQPIVISIAGVSSPPNAFVTIQE